MKGRAVIVKPRRRSRPIPPPSSAVLKRSSIADDMTAAPLVSTRMALGDRELQLARALSDTERSARDAAVISLERWLKEHGPDVDDLEWDRLCKALFYCVWMADKRPVISFVIDRIAGLGDVAGWPYLRALFRCIVREWYGVDKHRVNKFYELITVALEKCVARVVREGIMLDSNRDAVAVLMSIVQADVVDKAVTGSSGVALHLFDYWLDRVLKPLIAHASESFPGNEAHRIFDQVMAVPYSILGAKKVQHLALSQRAVERTILILPDALADADLKLNDKTQRDMMRRAMKKLWAAASAKDSHEMCRQGLYGAHASLKSHVASLEAKSGVLPSSARTTEAANVAEATVERSIGKERLQS